MEIVQNSNNLLKINELYKFFATKKIKTMEINNFAFEIINYTKSLILRINHYNNLTEKYKNELFPILECPEYDIALFRGAYIKIDLNFDIDLFEYCGQTPEQVWQELIKPDIEEYYGIKIEE